MLYNKDWDYKLNPVADVLMKAADLLEKHGHIKHLRGNLVDGMCALGALQEAQGANDRYSWDTPLTMEAARIVMGMVGSWSYQAAHATLAEWNNRPERTGQEVIDAFRKAAKVAARKNQNAA